MVPCQNRWTVKTNPLHKTLTITLTLTLFLALFPKPKPILLCPGFCRSRVLLVHVLSGLRRLCIESCI